MNHVYKVLCISTFFNPLEEAVVNTEDDILAHIVYAHSVDEARG
jgi:hypothetical protein